LGAITVLTLGTLITFQASKTLRIRSVRAALLEGP
jgi:hypothetical protein